MNEVISNYEKQKNLINNFNIEKNKTEIIEDLNKPNHKDGIDFVFEKNHELYQIWTKEQYAQYLNTIFPKSKIKDIVYHSSSVEITWFSQQEEGLWQFFFSKGKDTIRKLLANPEDPDNAKQVAVLLDIKIPKIEEFNEDDHDGQSYRMRFAHEEWYDAVLIENKNNPEDSERVVFKKNQIHILGSQKDIKQFKFWLQNKEQQKFV